VFKDGFEDPRIDPNGPEASGQEVTINGDTQLELTLVRPVTVASSHVWRVELWQP
jgi:hypothetical protein